MELLLLCIFLLEGYFDLIDGDEGWDTYTDFSLAEIKAIEVDGVS